MYVCLSFCLNDHHCQDRGIVTCEVCNKSFATQSSLDKHAYSHGDLKYVFEVCGQGYPFQSHLNQHMNTHILKKIACPVKSCTSEFKGTGDLNRHLRTHKKGIWFRCDFCEYKNKDKRNTSSHMKTHLKKAKNLVSAKIVKSICFLAHNTAAT